MRRYLWLVSLLAVVAAGCAGRAERAHECVMAVDEDIRAQIDDQIETIDRVSGTSMDILGRAGAYGELDRLQKTDPAQAKEMAAHIQGPRPTLEEVYRARIAYRDEVQRLHELILAGVAHYDAHLVAYPDDHDARDGLGHFLADNNLRYEAAEVWRELILRAPDRPTTYNNLGTLYTHMGRDMEAVDLFRRSIELDSTEPEYYFNLATMYSIHRKEIARKHGWSLPRVFREGLKAYGKARALRPEDFEYARTYAMAFITAKYFDVHDTADEAIAAWRYCLDLDLKPAERAWVLTNIGYVMVIEKGDKAAARPVLQQALELDPGSIRARDLLKKCEEPTQQ